MFRSGATEGPIGVFLRQRVLGLIAAAMVAAAFTAVPADARTKSKVRYRDETPSLDGRITGRPRTCGYEMFQYGPGGAPHGPYCH
jgi:hypothetical protein